jgi:hypothetical protein
MIDCMREAGWDFVVRQPAYPSAGCWEARDRQEPERILAQCFLRSARRAEEQKP